jgi:hypothetical protein
MALPRDSTRFRADHAERDAVAIDRLGGPSPPARLGMTRCLFHLLGNMPPNDDKIALGIFKPCDPREMAPALETCLLE